MGESQTRAVRLELAPIWRSVYLKFKANASEEWNSLSEWLFEENLQLCHVLCGERKFLNKKDIDLAIERIIKNENGNKRNIWVKIKIIRSLIVKVNEVLHLDLPLPSIPQLAKRTPSRFTPNNFQEIKRYRNFTNALNISIRDDDPDVATLVGQILLSSILYGGLLHNDSLRDFIRRLSNRDVSLLGNHLYFDLNPNKNDRYQFETRRWFPDILTSSLIIKFVKHYNDGHSLHSDVARTIMREYIKPILKRQSDLDVKSLTLNDILSCARTYSAIRLPPNLVDYASHKIRVQSLKTAVLSRLNRTMQSVENTHAGQSLVVQDEMDQSDRFLELWDEADNLEHPPLDSIRAIDAFPKLREALFDKSSSVYLGNDGGQLKKYLNRLLEQLDSINTLEYMFLSWLKSLVTSENGQYIVKMSTIRQYYSTVGRRLFEIIPPERSLVECSSEEFADFYTMIIEDIESLGHRRKLCKLLAKFHRYIGQHHNVVSIDYTDVLGMIHSPIPVDANILWPNEYQKALDTLSIAQQQFPNIELLAITRLLLILGYRCGLRRMEALRLRSVDVVGSCEEAHLLIRPWGPDRLKTKNAKRVIPLNPLMTPDEIQALVSWRDGRPIPEDRESLPPYLFGIERLNIDCVSEDFVFPKIHAFLRKVTGDPSFRYHHLRHSFATLTYLKVTSPCEGLSKEILGFPMTDIGNHLPADATQAALLGNHKPTRKILYLIAKILGHSGPDVSLQHYIHCADLCLLDYCHIRLSPDRATLVAASGLPASTAYRNLKGDLQSFILSRQRGLPLVEMAVLVDQEKVATEDDTERPVLERMAIDVYELLLLKYQYGLDHEHLATRFNLSLQEVADIDDAARALKSHYPFGECGDSAHRFKQIEGSIVPVPVFPRTSSDKAIMQRLIDRFGVLLEGDQKVFFQYLDLFDNHLFAGEYHLVAKELEDARVILKALMRLKIPKNQLALFVLVGRHSDKGPETQALRHWRGGLEGYARYFCGTDRTISKKILDQKAWLGIRIMNPSLQQRTTAFNCVMTLLKILLDTRRLDYLIASGRQDASVLH